MRLTFEKFDGRSQLSATSIIDADTGRKVGYITHGRTSFGGSGRIDVALFDRYRATVNRHEECLGFVRGVEAVLNHMIDLPDLAKSKAA
jgi:hypothetical protein